MTLFGAGALYSWLIADGLIWFRFLSGMTAATWLETVVSLLFIIFWCIYVLRLRKHAGWMTVSLVFASLVNVTLLLRAIETVVPVLPGLLHGLALVLTLVFLMPFAGLSMLFGEQWFAATAVLSVPWLLGSILFLLRAKRKEKEKTANE